MGDEKSCRIHACVLCIRGSQTIVRLIVQKWAQNGPKWPKNYIFKHQLFEDAALFALENSKDARGFGQSSTEVSSLPGNKVL